MGLLKILKKLKRKEKEMRLLMLGLDNAGKTTVLKAFNGEDINTISPTLGFNIQTLTYTVDNNQQNTSSTNETKTAEANTTSANNANSTYNKSNSSSNDNNNNISNEFNEVKSENNYNNFGVTTYKLNIWDVGGQQTIRSYWRNYFESTDGLIFVIDSSDKNRLLDVKTELHNLLTQEKLLGASLLIFANKQDINGALTKEDIASILDLKKIETSRHWHIQACSAFKGTGLREGIDWIVRDIASRIYVMD